MLTVESYKKTLKAVYNCFTNSDAMDQICKRHGVHHSSLSHAYKTWVSSVPESQPVDSSEIRIQKWPRKRLVSLLTQVKKDVVDVVKYFMDASIPLKTS